MNVFFKCLKPDCLRKVKPGFAYCCEACHTAATDHAPWELGPYDPDAHWVLVHSEYCEARKTERGACDPAEAVLLSQERPWTI